MRVLFVDNAKAKTGILRIEIFQHIRIFINTRQTDALEVVLRPQDQVHIICALSGG